MLPRGERCDLFSIMNEKQRHSDALSPENKQYCVLPRPPRFIKAAGVSVTSQHDPWDYSGTDMHTIRHRHVINTHIHHDTEPQAQSASQSAVALFKPPSELLRTNCKKCKYRSA